MFTVVAVDAKLEPLLKDYLPLYETAREEQIRMIRWNRQGGSVQRCGRTLDDAPAPYPFAGTSVAGMCLTPTAFLALQDGHVTVIPATCDSTLDRLIDRVPQLLAEAERMVRTLVERKKSGRDAEEGKGDGR